MEKRKDNEEIARDYADAIERFASTLNERDFIFTGAPWPGIKMGPPMRIPRGAPVADARSEEAEIEDDTRIKGATFEW